MLRSTILIYLIFSFIFTPVFTQPAQAAARKKSFVVLPVHEGKVPDKQLLRLRYKIQDYFLKSRKVSLIPHSKVVDYFNRNTENNLTQTEGDKLFTFLEDEYYSGSMQKSLEALIKIEELHKTNPGTNASLFKGYLFATLIHIFYQHPKKAFEAAKKAAALNLSVNELNEYLYPPTLRKVYQKAHKHVMANWNTKWLNIHVKGNKEQPIFLNGMYRGYARSLKIEVPSDHAQYVSAGNSTHSAVVIVAKEGKEITVAAKSIDKKLNKNFEPVGLKKDNDRMLSFNSLMLAEHVHADQIVLFELFEYENFARLVVKVVDVDLNKITKPKNIDIVDINEDANTAASIAVDFASNLSQRDFFEPSEVTQVDSTPVIVGDRGKKKSFFKKPIGMVLIGAVVVGAATAIAVGATAGGSSGSGVTNTSVTGPLPTVPGN
jgi:hypothetical protein